MIDDRFKPGSYKKEGEVLKGKFDAAILRPADNGY
jgi:hypothetical protein